MWMVPQCLSAWAAGRLAGWLPAFVVLWNAWRLGAGLGWLAGLLDVDGAWAAGRLAACFCSFVECLEAWSWTWDLAVVCR